MKTTEYSLEIAGKKIEAIFSDLADQTNSSVIIKSGETAVLITAVMSQEKTDSSYFPLVVDYEERFYAAGMILGSRFMKREGRPSEEATLTGRVVDRTIRPLFDQRERRSVQIVATTLAIDSENDPDVLAIIGASLALSVSNIPWEGPVGAVRICQKERGGAFIVNPTYDERKSVVLDALICGKDGKINMIETEAKEIDNETAKNALLEALKQIALIEEFQKNIIKEIGQQKELAELPSLTKEGEKLFDEKISPLLAEIFLDNEVKSKLKIKNLEKQWGEIAKKELADEDKTATADFFNKQIDELIHKEAIENERRPDGRKMNEVRNIEAKAGGFSGVLHGSGIFYRGGTHVFSALTLAGPGDSQIFEGMETREKRYFIHHYNFLPYSTGETGRLGVNRRSIGHGALAEKALRGVIPDRETFPYTIRLVSESMASNGSTSMGSVCGSSLALMDGGVPIKNAVAGIAMGLMILPDGRYKVLTDIQGPEDHHGDMDFKVAGTKDGITAIQMDVKIDGVSIEILAEAMRDAEAARIHILGVMTEAIDAPRKSLKPSAPKISVLKVDQEKIGMIIGSGGKTIQKITKENGVQIDIEEEDGGFVYITGLDQAAVDNARQTIESIVKEYAAGDIVEGEVIKLFDFGAVLKFGYMSEGLVHISEIAPFRINSISEILKEGEKVKASIRSVDKETGKISLSIKDADPSFAERKGIKASTNYSGGKTDNDKRRPFSR